MGPTPKEGWEMGPEGTAGRAICISSRRLLRLTSCKKFPRSLRFLVSIFFFVISVSLMVRLAIIIPFRDTDGAWDVSAAASTTVTKFEQLTTTRSRSAQLNIFLTYMRDVFFARAASSTKVLYYVVEQKGTEDKFNRGKLLNIGFEAAVRDGATSFIFHDVDLVPHPSLLTLYEMHPIRPIHIGKLFRRYNGNPDYFGGIVAMSEAHFRATNGYPNSLYGWGYEDESQFWRLGELGLYSIEADPVQQFIGRPDVLLYDLEGYSSFGDKKVALDAADARNMAKWEIKNRDRDAAYWVVDGLSSLSSDYYRIETFQSSGQIRRIYVSLTH